MKRIFFLIAASLISVALSAQTWGYNTMEMKVKDGNDDLILEAFEGQVDNVKMVNGSFWLEWIYKGSDNGMTHRMGWAWELGTDWVTEKDPKGTELFWYKMEEYVEEWGPSYSGRVLSWKEATDNPDDNKFSHAWDFKVKNPKQFKTGHDNFVKRFEKEFDGHEIFMGSYDFHGPNGATHFVGVTGKDMEDHLMLYDELQKQDDFYKLLSERGEVERVRDIVVEFIIGYPSTEEN